MSGPYWKGSRKVPRKLFSVEQIINHMREADILTGSGSDGPGGLTPFSHPQRRCKYRGSDLVHWLIPEVQHFSNERPKCIN